MAIKLALILFVTVAWVLILGGTGYAVFVLHHSGWWFALAVPLVWAASSVSITDGKERP